MTTAALPSVLHPRRLGVLFVVALADLGIWVLAGCFATSEFYRRTIVMGGVAAVDQTLVIQMITALNWAAFTPFVVLIAQRLPVRPPHRMRNAAIIVLLIPVLAVLRAAMGGAVLDAGEHHYISAYMVHLSVGIRSHRYAAIIAAIFFVVHLVEAQRESAERERQRARAQTLLARTELEELRMRLQPQFAVRMLRHIGSVLREEPKSADGLIVTLSGILRRSMARGSEERIRLADELDHFDRCLDLCRAGDRFSVTARYLAGDDVLASRVPAHCLQPVIETLVLDLTSGAGGSVEVHCARGRNETRIDVAWIVAPEGAKSTSTLSIPFEEAYA